MKEKVKTILKYGIEPIVIFISAIATIGLGVSMGFSTNALVSGGFFIALSLIMIQILIQQYFIREENEQIIHTKTEPIKDDTVAVRSDTGCIKKTTLDLSNKIKTWESILFPRTKNHLINARVVSLFEDNQNSKMKMKIICYGTSKFGGLVEDIKNLHGNTKFEIIICSPHSPVLASFRNEQDALNKVIAEMATDKDITLYASTIPPTIRALLISKGEEECHTWCSVQPYYMYLKNDGRLFRGEHFTPTILAADEESIVMPALKKIFDDEFGRLMAVATKVSVDESTPKA